MSNNTVIAAPDALALMARGVEQLAELLALTLGPCAPGVLNAVGRARPEVLHDSGTIARRVVETPVRGADAGAMLLRNMAWTMRERYGDGVATASVLAAALVQGAVKHVVAGSDPMLLRRGIERGVAAACQALVAQAAPAIGQEQLARLASSVTSNLALAAVLGELFQQLRPHPAILIEEFAAPYLNRQYLDGGRWRARPAIRALMPENGSEQILRKPLLFLVQEPLVWLAQVLPVLEFITALPEKPPLLCIAPEIGGEALATLALNHARGTLSIGTAVLTMETSRSDDLHDIALLSGAQIYGDERGRSIRHIQPESLGCVEKATVSREYLTLLGRSGGGHAIESCIAALHVRQAQPDCGEAEREQLRMRAARLAGGVGILKIGAHTPLERAAMKDAARKALRVLDGALEAGLVPGGGMAYLRSIAAVEEAQAACRYDDEAFGVACVAQALEAPFLQLVKSTTLYPPLVLAEVRQRGLVDGFDVATERYVPVRDMAVCDTLSITRAALEMAASVAAMTITTDQIVLSATHRREPQIQP